MKQKLVSFAAAVCIAVSSLVPAAASSSAVLASNSTTYGNGSININLYAPSIELPNMLEKFFGTYPSMASKYKVTATVQANDACAYEILVNAGLCASEGKGPDLFIAEADYLYPYTKGEMSSYVAPYSSFVANLSTKMTSAEIMPYISDLGRSSDGKVMGLAYQSTPGVMIYNSAIAKNVFGTDDPSKISSIVGGGTQSWDKFIAACAKLKAKGYAAVSGLSDLWNVASKASTTPWVVNGKLKIDTQKYKFLDICQIMTKNNYANMSYSWSEDWYLDMMGEGTDPQTGSTRKVFSFFGPAWLINYVLKWQTSDTWKVCESPLSFWWGGSWLLVNKKSIANSDKKEFISKFVEWVTLDTSTTGVQYSWANGSFASDGSNDTVASMAVLKKVTPNFSCLGGQNPFPIFVKAGKTTQGKSVSAYDVALNSEWGEAFMNYSFHYCSRPDSIYNFLIHCEECGIDVSGISASMQPVKNLRATSAGNKKVRLSWTPDYNADGYLIYAQKNKKYAYIGMTSMGTTSTYLDTAALDTDYNYYWVFPFYYDYFEYDSEPDMVTAACSKYVYAKGICSAVTNLKANGTTGKVTLTWTASEGADGYLIYGIRPGGKYGYIGMASGTTFPDTKASKTDWTFYWVFPYNKVGDKMIVGGTAPYVYSKAR
jgi:hypothetical protein